MGDKVKVSVLETNGSEELEGPAERSLTADIVEFHPSGTTFPASADDLDKVVKELRKKVITVPTTTVTTLNGSLVLTSTSNTFEIISGTATGFSVHLPDATTIPVGSDYIIYNESSQSINIKDFGGTSLVTLNPDSQADFKLESNPTSAGSWIFIINATTAVGITSYVVTSGTLFSTTSTTDALITGFSVTPVSGRYFVVFSAETTIVGNNRVGQYVTYADGVAVENTRRVIQGVGSNFNTTMVTTGEVSVDGSQAVDVRCAVDANSLEVEQRSLVLIRLGSV